MIKSFGLYVNYSVTILPLIHPQIAGMPMFQNPIKEQQMSIEKQLSKQDQSRITKSIQDGQKVIKDGGTKVEASMTIFRVIHDLDQETVVKTFIEGASLTPKGALTYWYNCRRKLRKEQISIQV